MLTTVSFQNIFLLRESWKFVVFFCTRRDVSECRARDGCVKPEHLVVCTERDTDAHFFSCLAHVTDHQDVDWSRVQLESRSIHLMSHGTLLESQFSAPWPFCSFLSTPFCDLHTESCGHFILAESFNESETPAQPRKEACCLAAWPNKALLHLQHRYRRTQKTSPRQVLRPYDVEVPAVQCWETSYAIPSN